MFIPIDQGQSDCVLFGLAEAFGAFSSIWIGEGG